MQKTKRIENNKAIRALMDDSLMVGRHRPIVANWYQNWVEYVSQSALIEGEVTPEQLAKVKGQIADLIALEIVERIEFTMKKICTHADWRPGRPFISGAPIATEVQGSVQVFLPQAKSDVIERVGPNDSSKVLGRETA